METQMSRSNVIAASDTEEMDFCAQQSTIVSQKRIANELALEIESKKPKCNEIQQSPDLFDDDDYDPQDNDERKVDDNDCANDDDGQCDDNDAIQSHNVPFENPLVSDVQATPPNPFITQTHDLLSEPIDIQGIIAAMVTQTQQSTQIERLPSLQQQQPASEVPPNSPMHLSTAQLIEELEIRLERVDLLIDQIKESS